MSKLAWRRARTFLGADWDGPDCADWPELMTVTQAASLQSPRESLPRERKRIAASDASVWETVFVRQDADYWGLVRALQQACIEDEIRFELRMRAQSDFCDRVFRAADYVGWLRAQGVQPAPMVKAWHQATVKANATPAQPAEVLRPVQHQASHEAAIVGALRQASFDPLQFPVAPAGKPSPAKKAAREALLPSMSASVFDKAWERLRSDGRIADARPSDKLGEGGRLQVGR